MGVLIIGIRIPDWTWLKISSDRGSAPGHWSGTRQQRWLWSVEVVIIVQRVRCSRRSRHSQGRRRRGSNYWGRLALLPLPLLLHVCFRENAITVDVGVLRSHVVQPDGLFFVAKTFVLGSFWHGE